MSSSTSVQQKGRGQFDVVIVGAGIAGSALACALADTRLRVALIEVQPLAIAMPQPAAGVNGFDPRVSALTAASQQLLARLGAWDLIAAQRVCGYREMRVWDADGTGSIHFDCADIHQPVLGHIVENRLITAALAQQLPLIGNVSVLAPQQLQSMEPRAGGGHHLQLESGLALEADLVVGADGAMSIVRKLMGLKTREWDYGHHAIVATIETTKPHQLTAWQRFMPSGPLAFLPLETGDGSQQFCSIVWSAQSDYAQQLMALDDAAFRLALADAFEHRLGDIASISKRFMFPLKQRHAVDYIAPGIALIGDAAHTIHPLVGQGINLGLLDVIALAESLQHASARGLASGDMAVLGRYQRARKGHNLLMMGVMEGFKRLFEQPALPLRWLRNEGLRQVDAKPWLKREIMRQAMGL
jgi:2-octaprenylphenol hydroxylase